MRHTKIILIIYLLASLGAFLAFLAMRIHTSVDADSEIYGQIANIFLIYFAILVAMAMYGLICFVRSHAKFSYAAAAVYLLIVFTAFYVGSASKLDIRGRMYAWHPELCRTTSLQMGHRATLCYEERDSADGSIRRIVYNPDDEMSLPESQWSKDVEQTFGGNLWPVRLARHIYLQDSADYDSDSD